MPKSSKKTRSRRNKTTLKGGGIFDFFNKPNPLLYKPNPEPAITNPEPAIITKPAESYYEQFMAFFNKNPEVKQQNNPPQPQDNKLGGKTRRNRKSSKRK